MNLKDYKSGKFLQQYEYKSFSPTPINHIWIWDDPQINVMLERAAGLLRELNAFGRFIPDIDTFIYMHIAKEANTSSRIEGTQTTMDDVLLSEDEVDPEKRDDWNEVQNYIRAMNYSIEELKNLPLSNRLIRKAHEMLLSGVRGEHRSPGNFRESQNWIGGSSLSDAVYIPPGHTEVPELMADLEKFLHNDKINVPHLIKIAIAHYQFETIHPFLDGNGRIGRLLITLYLVSNQILNKPFLYLSDFFEKNKGNYYDALTHVRIQHDIGHWLRFFLNAVIQTATMGVDIFNQIIKLKEEVNGKVLGLGRKSKNAQKLIDYLYQFPIVNINNVVSILKISRPAAHKLINDLVKLDLLNEMTKNQRYRKYTFRRYYKLFLQ